MLRNNLLSVLTGCVWALALSLILNLFSRTSYPFYGFSLLYFALFCFGFNLIYAFKAGSEDFTGLLIAGIAIKLILAFFIVFVYTYLDHARFLVFSAHFIGHYILFTVFEIRYLFRLIRLHRKT